MANYISQSTKPTLINTSILLNLIISLFIIPFSFNALAAEPVKFAKSDRHLWPYQINTAESFDLASQHEIMSFIEQLNEVEILLKTEDDLKTFVARKNVNMDSVKKYISNIKLLMTRNYNKANHNNPLNFSIQELTVHSSNYLKKVPDNLVSWRNNSKKFYSNYIYEQIRLAALFPKITSEIDTLEETEINGLKLKDKHFLLTFDDGPSPKGGTTDNLISTLNQYHKKAMFFVLGDNFIKRNDVKNLYQGFIVNSHGKEHKAHTESSFYEPSILFTLERINRVFEGKKPCYFRPPYGQRTVSTILYLKQYNCSVVLWNIDSQDWSSQMTSNEVKDRVLTLMLLWRSGIILFHDIHPKAGNILPEIFEQLKDTDVIFTDDIQSNDNFNKQVSN